jgi:hypothetical protein
MIDFDSNAMDIEFARVKTILLKREYSYEQLLSFAAHCYVALNAQCEIVNDCMAAMGSDADTFRALSETQEILINQAQEIMLDLLEENKNSMKQGVLAGIKSQKIIQAKKGAIAKRAKYEPLKELAKKLVDEKNFKSRRQAAMIIAPQIIAESEKLNMSLSKTQAEITIASWLKEMGLPAKI